MIMLAYMLSHTRAGTDVRKTCVVSKIKILDKFAVGGAILISKALSRLCDLAETFLGIDELFPFSHTL